MLKHLRFGKDCKAYRNTKEKSFFKKSSFDLFVVFLNERDHPKEKEAEGGR